ncbi:hypothetical protein M9H77_13093 [Catharanthus roseus]|uniref:Uncharacterized protein n=1 Tax=Catharanthus roseus TaxID=4058 RepID=A0ACC0BJF4_CATRO|nr:hypothetical protein M9H77_13093 [Catharanthus roseus]
MVEEVLCLSAQQGYTIFYRNCDDSNVLIYIIVAHPTSIQMMRTWSYVQYATVRSRRDDSDWHIDQNVLAKLTELIKDHEVASRFVNSSWHKLLNEIDEQEYLRKLDVLKTKWQKRSDFLHYLFTTWLNPLAHKFVRVWTSRVLYFGVETANHVESEHSVLKLWLLTCHGDLDTVFLNIDSLIEGQIANIKSSLEYSRVIENFNAKNNLILKNISNKINYFALKKIWVEIKRAPKIIDDPKNKCGHYMRTLHGLPYSCELIKRFDHMLPIQLVDIEAFLKTLEIGGYHPSLQEMDMDMDSEMCALTNHLHQISTGPISKVREMRLLAKGILSTVLPKDPSMTLTSPPEVTTTKGQRKTNSTERDKSYWEHVSIAHRKIQKERPARAPRGMGRGCSRGQSGLSSVTILSLCSTFPYTDAFPTFMYPFIENRKNVIGDGNCGYRVVADFVFGDKHQWLEVRRRRIFELEHTTNMYLSLFESAERIYELVRRTQWQNGPALSDHWLETPDSLYVIANTFNLCVILIARLGCTIVLPLYSYSDRPSGTLVIWLLTDQQHFIQVHHRSDRVSNWVEAYSDRIAYWNMRFAREYPPGDPIHVY